MTINAQLVSFIERIERLTEEKKALSADITEVYSEAKANGYDTKIMRKVIAIRAKDVSERSEEEALLDTYLTALGMNNQPGLFEVMDEMKANPDHLAGFKETLRDSGATATMSWTDRNGTPQEIHIAP